MEYMSNNSPHNYLASSQSLLEKENKPKTKLLLSEVKKIPRQQLNISNFQQKHSNFAYMPQIPQNKQPKLNFQNQLSDKERLKVSLKNVKIEELGLKKPIFPGSNPTNPSQFDDLKEVSSSLKKVLVSLNDNGPKEPTRTLPKMG